jgi:hypothetical protein
VFPVRYELGFYIPEDGSLHTHRRENLKCLLNDDFSNGLYSNLDKVTNET